MRWEDHTYGREKMACIRRDQCCTLGTWMRTKRPTTKLFLYSVGYSYIFVHVEVKFHAT